MRYLISAVLCGLLIACSQTSDKKGDSVSIVETNTPANKKASDDQNQGFEKKSKGDSLIIVDSELTYNPFGFSRNPLGHLLSIKDIQIEKVPIENRHIKNQVDTSFKITVGPDFFKVYKAASKNFLTEANIYSKRFSLYQEIRVGLTKTEFRKKMNNYNIKTVPDHVRLKNLHVSEWIDLRFENDTLVEIKFKGYVD